MIELLMAIVVLGVLLGLALPSYRTFVISNRLTAQINELVGDLSLARGEAGTRSRVVTICIAASSTSCATSGTDWAVGRIIWVDTNGNGSIDSASGEIIKYVPALDGGVTLNAVGPTLSLLPYGGLSGASTWTFTLCAPGESKGRQLNLPLTGRASVKRIETCS